MQILRCEARALTDMLWIDTSGLNNKQFSCRIAWVMVDSDIVSYSFLDHISSEFVLGGFAH